ncbi:corrinoid-binding protein [Geobacter pickeringii]|uniref:Corrinoid-binding protein n=1 Tax=Geobacter pickeringii TaxID=345632 RepID=A0A0B5BDX1_9BACT|nr:corrinoid-binding protein [Geobacter pickeringii]
MQALIAELSRMIDEADREGANRLIDRWAATHGYQSALSEVLEPLLREVGERWEREDISLAQSFVAGKVAEDILNKALAAAPAGTLREVRGTVVLGNIEDDYHSLGRRMVGTFLRAAGWGVIDLGNDVPAVEFVDRAVEAGARVIGVSAMMLVTARGIRAVREELDRRGLSGRIMLAVGGAIFKVRPELVAEVGGDGTAENAIAAPALMESLRERSLRGEGQ